MSVENISLFNSVLDEALERLGKKNLKLKECQYKAVKAVVVDRKDTICILPTGYGKWLIYQLLPFVLLNYLFPTHAQYGRHTVFCMSITDYPRASVSFPRDRRLGERDCFRTKLANLSLSRIYFGSKLLVDLQFFLLNMTTKFQQVSQRKIKDISG